MRRFYLEHTIGDQLSFSEEESKHIVRVLRMQKNDELEIVNGKGELLQCSITDAGVKKCQVSVLKRTFSEEARPLFHLAIAPTKNMDRIEWLVEKSTELGLGRITFLKCKNNERTQLKTDRILKIAISAMKQSKSLYLPIIDEMIDVETFLKNHPKGYIAHCYTSERISLYSAISDASLPILIGPEGDFSENEVQKAQEIGYLSVDLGKTRLRTETAGLFACSIVKLKTE